MSRKNKPVTITQETTMQEPTTETTIEQEVVQVEETGVLPEQEQQVEVQEPVQEEAVAQVVEQQVTEITPQPISAPQTPEQAYLYLIQNGTPLQKSVLETVDNFIDKNSGPFQYGLVAAVSSQAQLLQAILQMFKSIFCEMAKQIADMALYTLNFPKSFKLNSVLFIINE